MKIGFFLNIHKKFYIKSILGMTNIDKMLLDPLPAASSKIRGLEIIKSLNKLGHNSYMTMLPIRIISTDVFVFQKLYRRYHYICALFLKILGKKTIVDINENFFKNGIVCSNILKMASVCTATITPSEYYKKKMEEYGIKNVFLIHEGFSESNFKKKNSTNKKINKLIYVGYNKGLSGFKTIRECLINSISENNLELTIISNKKPSKDFGIPHKWKKYCAKTIKDDMLSYDVFIAPRDIKNKDDLGHSFTKIGLPMSLGIPVVCTPLMSYMNSPAIFCKNEEEWTLKLKKIISDSNYYSDVSKRSQKYVKDNYSQKNIVKRYIEVFAILSKIK